jgi:hypothetical protein
VPVCQNCGSEFQESRWRFLINGVCSYHPGDIRWIAWWQGSGTRPDQDVYDWTCCRSRVLLNYNSPETPNRSPGCERGEHVAGQYRPVRVIDEGAVKAEAEAASSCSSVPILSLAESQIPAQVPDVPDRSGRRHRDIFISYSHSDAVFVDELTSRLAADGVAVWRDEKDILIGDPVDRVISDAIQESPLFLVVLSPASVKSTWLQRELDEASHAAADGRKVILPILTGGLRYPDVPAQVRRLRCADFSADYARAYALLLESVRRRLSNMPTV